MKKKIIEVLKHVGGFSAVILGLFLCWSAAYFIISRIFAHYGVSHLSEWTKQIINSFSGFFLFGLIMFAISKIGRIRERQQKFFNRLIESMEKMARGNFNIDLSYYKNYQDHPFQEIIQSVSHMAEELKEIEQMRQEFISNVSHEIQSPLTSIRGFANALQNDYLSKEESAHYLQIIETETMRLSKISANLLKLTSLESDHPPFEPMPYRLDQQLRSVILACEPQWTDKKIAMEVSLDEIIVCADKELINQVWINLLHNSIKFTAKNGKIGVSLTENSDGRISVIIEDTGIGMTKEVQMHIFERFYKGDPSRNRSIGGSGLGLSIVKKIVEMHQGEILVRSEPGKGTEFTLLLPKPAGSSK